MFADDTSLTATGESSFEVEYKLMWKSKTLSLA